MGGRRTYTEHVDTRASSSSTGHDKFVSDQRNLGDKLCGCIFGCTAATRKECVEGLIFGLPGRHWVYVENIYRGMPLFLFNYSSKELYGIFQATNNAEWELNPTGWSQKGEKTGFPAQVAVKLLEKCPGLKMADVIPLIPKNVDSKQRLIFELDYQDVRTLLRKFLSMSNKTSQQIEICVQEIMQQAHKGWTAFYRNRSPGQGQRPSQRPAAPTPSTSTQVQSGLPRFSQAPPSPALTEISKPRGAWSRKLPEVVNSNQPSNPTTTQQPVSQTRNPSTTTDKSILPAPPDYKPSTGTIALTGSWGADLCKLPNASNSPTVNEQNADNSQRSTSVDQPNRFGGDGWGADGWGKDDQWSLKPQNVNNDNSDNVGQAVPINDGNSGWGDRNMWGDSSNNNDDKDLPENSLNAVKQPPVSDFNLNGYNVDQNYNDSCTRRELQEHEWQTTTLSNQQDFTEATVASEWKQPSNQQPEQNSNNESSNYEWPTSTQSNNNNISITSNVSGQQQCDLLLQQLSQQEPEIAYAVQQQFFALADSLNGLVQRVEQNVQRNQAAADGKGNGSDMFGEMEQQVRYNNQKMVTCSEQIQKMVGQYTDMAKQLQESIRLKQEQDQKNNSEQSFLEMIMDDGKEKEVARVVNSQLFVMGGFSNNQSSWMNRVDVYDANSNSWSQKTSMPEVCAYGAAVEYQDNIFFVGGGKSREWYQTAYKYDISQDKWSQISNMNTARGSLGFVQLDGRIYALGGGQKHMDGQMIHHNSVEVYDLVKDEWTFDKPMNKKRFTTGAVTINNAIYAVGGYDGSAYLTSIERFDPREGVWQECMHMTLPRGAHGIASVNHAIVVAAGFSGTAEYYNSVEALDVRKGKSYQLPSLKSKQVYGILANLGGKLFSLGGMSKSGGPKDIQVLDMYKEGSSWESFALEQSNDILRHFMGSCVVNRYT